MNKIKFNHIASGVSATVNGQYLGIFENEKEIMYYLLLNDYLENVFIERTST